jgi:Sec-independent protein translocase protein TatA
MKYSKIPQVRDILRLKIKEFLSRAESIKAFLESQKQKQNQREKNNEKPKTQTSQEKSALRRQLESCNNGFSLSKLLPKSC